jgi:hypothetical protein
VYLHEASEELSEHLADGLMAVHCICQGGDVTEDPQHRVFSFVAEIISTLSDLRGLEVRDDIIELDNDSWELLCLVDAHEPQDQVRNQPSFVFEHKQRVDQ